MLIVAGVGPGHERLMTREVYDLIVNGEKVIAFGRVSRGIENLREDIVSVVKVSELNELIGDEDTVLLASGDPEFYGVVDYLKRSGIHVDRVVPGLSSFQYLMSAIQKSWQDANLFSLHGRDYDLSEALKYSLNICLTDGVHTPSSISKELYDLGARGKITAGYDLSYDEEKIITKNIGDDFPTESILAVVVIEIEMD